MHLMPADATTAVSFSATNQMQMVHESCPEYACAYAYTSASSCTQYRKHLSRRKIMNMPAEEAKGGEAAEKSEAKAGDGSDEDEGLANAKYTVVTHSVPRPAHRTDFVRMRDKAGTLFDCVLPSSTTADQDAKVRDNRC